MTVARGIGDGADRRSANECGDAVVTERCRGSQAGRPAADDEDVCVETVHWGYTLYFERQTVK